MSKAVVAKVDLGFTVIEGLQLPDGSYAIGVSQAAKCLSVPLKHSSKQFKALLCKDSSFPSVKSELNSRDVNILTLSEFMLLLTKLARTGNELAWDLLEATATETFERRFDSAFNVKRSEEERNARLSARLRGKVARRTLTYCYKAYCEENQIEPNYAKMTMQTLNIIGMKPGRDDKTEKELLELMHIENFVAARLSKGYDYLGALRQWMELTK